MTKSILAITSSGRIDSVSTLLVKDILSHLTKKYVGSRMHHNDLAKEPAAFVDDSWITANFTPDEAKTAEQKTLLAASDRYVDEVLGADIIVIGMPIYNFSIPAALKAWVDQIIRAKRTFAYKAGGGYDALVPAGKKVIIVATSGGVPVGSGYDLATPYLRHVLGFIGLTDVEVIAADQQMTLGASQTDKAKAEIARMFG
ncbi:MAG: FMN-dependent NADH-azoreductase [Beijerinckiaceae bacterium]